MRLPLTLMTARFTSYLKTRPRRKKKEFAVDILRDLENRKILLLSKFSPEGGVVVVVVVELFRERKE